MARASLPTRPYSAGSDVDASMKALTPAAYASSMARVSAFSSA